MSDRKGITLKAFRDAGTKKRFAAGQEYSFSPGEFANFEAAGLISAPPAPESKTAAKTAAA